MSSTGEFLVVGMMSMMTMERMIRLMVSGAAGTMTVTDEAKFTMVIHTIVTRHSEF